MADNPNYVDTGMFDNSGIWIFALLILLFGAGGFGFGGNGGLTENTLERAIDLNSVQNGQRDIESRVQEIGAENIAATKDMGYNLLGNILCCIKLKFCSTCSRLALCAVYLPCIYIFGHSIIPFLYFYFYLHNTPLCANILSSRHTLACV